MNKHTNDYRFHWYMLVWLVVGFLPCVVACFTDEPALRVAVIILNCAVFLMMLILGIIYESRYRSYVTRKYPGVLKRKAVGSADKEAKSTASSMADAGLTDYSKDTVFQQLAHTLTDLNKFVLISLVITIVFMSKAIGLW